MKQKPETITIVDNKEEASVEDATLDKQFEEEVARAFDIQPSKAVMIDFGDYLIRADYECKDKNTDICDKCRLRFNCYLHQYLILKANDLPLNIDETITEIVERYIEIAKQKSNK